MSEPTYTLEEAGREIARRQCLTTGHRWEHVVGTSSGLPVRIFCERCGQSGTVTFE